MFDKYRQSPTTTTQRFHSELLLMDFFSAMYDKAKVYNVSQFCSKHNYMYSKPKRSSMNHVWCQSKSKVNKTTLMCNLNWPAPISAACQ